MLKRWLFAGPSVSAQAQGLSHLAGRIILAFMGDVHTLLLPVQEGRIWRVQIVWPNGAVHYFGKFTSKRDATAWINAHPRLTKPEDTMDTPHDADRSC